MIFGCSDIATLRAVDSEGMHMIGIGSDGPFQVHETTVPHGRLIRSFKEGGLALLDDSGFIFFDRGSFRLYGEETDRGGTEFYLVRMDIYEDDIPDLMRRHPDMFSKDEIDAFDQGRLEIRVCDECGEFMCSGYMSDEGMIHLCSRECAHKAGWTDKEMLCSYWGFDIYSPGVRRKMETLSYEELERWCRENGNEDDSYLFYTEWEDDPDLVDRLNKARMKEIDC